MNAIKKLWRTVLYRIADELPLRIISDGTRPYLERHYIGTVFGLRVYLHRFVGDDPDRGLHDHPWSWACSFVLAGWYNELRRTHLMPRPVRWFNWLRADTFHRVLLPRTLRELDVSNPRTTRAWNLRVHPCWTLFIHPAKSCKPWGFWRETPAGTFSLPNPDGDTRIQSHRPASAHWEQFTYDHGGMGSGDWWNDTLIAKLHPQRLPQD